jgi:hypothetical protein
LSRPETPPRSPPPWPAWCRTGRCGKEWARQEGGWRWSASRIRRSTPLRFKCTSTCSDGAHKLMRLDWVRGSLRAEATGSRAMDREARLWYCPLGPDETRILSRRACDRCSNRARGWKVAFFSPECSSLAGCDFRGPRLCAMQKDAVIHYGVRRAPEVDFCTLRVGRVLKGTGLDELPNRLSLWKGDMSFVGLALWPSMKGCRKSTVAPSPIRTCGISASACPSSLDGRPRDGLPALGHQPSQLVRL